MKRLLAVALVALATAAPARAYYADGGGGGNRPDCNGDNLGAGWGNWLCGRDAFTGDTDWVWWG